MPSTSSLSQHRRKTVHHPLQPRIPSNPHDDNQQESSLAPVPLSPNKLAFRMLLFRVRCEVELKHLHHRLRIETPQPKRNPLKHLAQSAAGNAFTPGPWTPGGQVFVGKPTVQEAQLFYRLEELPTTGSSGTAGSSECKENMNLELALESGIPSIAESMDNEDISVDTLPQEELKSSSERLHLAALRIQTWWKQQLQQRTLQRQAERERTAIIRMQALVRRKQARTQFLNMQAATRTLQRAWRRAREQRLQQQVHHGRLIRAVLFVQSAYRRNLQRNRFQKIQKSVVRIQAAWKGFVERRTIERQRQAAIRLQSIWRAVRQRRAFLLQKKAAVKIQAVWRGVREYRRFQRCRKAAMVLQTLARVRSAFKRKQSLWRYMHTIEVVRTIFRGGDNVDLSKVKTLLSREQLQQLQESVRSVPRLDQPAVADNLSESETIPPVSPPPRQISLLPSPLPQPSSLNKTASIRSAVEPATPSRIPKPVFSSSKPRSETPTPNRIPVVPSRRISLRIQGRVQEPVVVKTEDPLQNDLMEKQRKLAAIRAQKERLQAKLKESSSGSGTATPAASTIVVSAEPEPKPTPASVTAIAPPPPPKVVRITNPKDAVSLLMANLDRLSPAELKQLSEANTRVNGKYTRPISYVVVEKQGPKPPSPNAKTLSKLAAANRKAELQQQSNSRVGRGRLAVGAASNQQETRNGGKQVQWRQLSELVSTQSLASSPRTAMSRNPSRSCLRRPVHVERNFESIQQQVNPLSPIRVQRIVYVENQPPARRLTGVNGKAAGRRK